MIVDPKALKDAGYSQEKLKKLFTDAANPKLKKPSEEVIKVKSLIELHAHRIDDGIRRSLSHARYTKAVDDACDVAKNQITYTLVRGLIDRNKGKSDAENLIATAQAASELGLDSLLVPMVDTQGRKLSYDGRLIKNSDTKPGYKINLPVFFNVYMPVVMTYVKTRQASLFGDREILRPWSGSYQLDLGWDIGDQNTAVILASPRQQGGALCYDILDEIIILRTPTSVESFVRRVMEMMDYWRNWLRTENGVHEPMWRHFSDSSSMTQRMFLGGTEAQRIHELSGGLISLYGVTKGRDSVSKRKDFLRRLLFENRVAVSSRCTGVIEMLRHLPPKTSKTLRDDLSGKDVFVQDGIDPNSPLRHCADALTYMLSSCIPMTAAQGIGSKDAPRALTMEM